MAKYSSSNERQAEVEKDIKNIEEALKSPATPENMKNVFRKQLTQLKDKLDALKSSSGSTYEEELKRQQRSGQAVGQGISLSAMAERMGIPITHVEPPVKKQTPAVERKTEKKKPVPKAEKSTDPYDCNELIKQAKERKRKAQERASLPKKTPATKNKEKIESVFDNVKERIADEDITKSEIEKLIMECKALLKLLQNINLKLARKG